MGDDWVTQKEEEEERMGELNEAMNFRCLFYELQIFLLNLPCKFMLKFGQCFDYCELLGWRKLIKLLL